MRNGLSIDTDFQNHLIKVPVTRETKLSCPGQARGMTSFIERFPDTLNLSKKCSYFDYNLDNFNSI